MSTLDIRSFGAVADGQTVNTVAIQQAIDACRPGDQVLIAGGVYVSGALFLKSDMSLCIAEGAMLLGSDDLADYPVCRYTFEGREKDCYASLINTVDIRDTTSADPWYEDGFIREVDKRLNNIIIEGKGTIDANGSILRRKQLAEAKGERGRAIALRNVDGVVIRDVTVRHAPAWCVHPIFCTDVTLENVTIRTKFAPDGSRYDMVNGDGLDPDSCRHVRVTGCTIESQDDCIAIKSGRDEAGRVLGMPTEDVVIQDCTFRYGFGVAMGSEMSGGIRNVLVQDCVFEDTFSIASVKAPRGRGGFIENVTYERLRHTNSSTEHQDCRWFRGAIYVDQFYSYEDFDAAAKEPVSDGTATIRDITFRDIEISTVAGNAIYLMGLPEQPLENITLTQVEASGKRGMIVGNVHGLHMENVDVCGGAL